MAEIFERDIDNFQVEPIRGRISASGDALFDTYRVTIKEVESAPATPRTVDEGNKDGDPVPAGEKVLSPAHASDVAKNAAGKLLLRGTVPQFLKLRPQAGKKTRMLHVAATRAHHMLKRRGSHCSDSGQGDEEPPPGIDQSQKRTATRCIIRFRHPNRRVSALAQQYRVR